MAENNLPGESAGPVADTPKSEDELIGEIADLVADPAEDHHEEVEDHGAETDPDDPEVDVSEDVEDEADADAEDGPQEIKGGRFAPDSAKVTLEDGSVITVAELKRNNLFQRDYTRKTTELAAEREQITARSSQVDQQAQSLAQQVEYLNWFAERYLPKAPEPFQGTAETDPVGYMKYMQALQGWQEQQGFLNHFNTERAKLAQEAEEKSKQDRNQHMQAEFQTLRQKDQFFTDPVKTRAFIEETLTKGGEWWGLTAEDMAGLSSHKAFLILRDAVKYRKALAKAPEVQRQVQARPVLKAGRRVDTKAKVSSEKQARSERLRRDGSFQNGVASLMDLDL